MRQEQSRIRTAGLAFLLLAGGFATWPGPAAAGQRAGSFGGFQGRGMAVGAPAHQGIARAMPAPGPMVAPGTTLPVPPMQSGFLNQGFVPAITPGFENQGFIPPIAPGFLNEGFIPAIAPGFLNEGFIPPLVGASRVTAQPFGFHRHAFQHRFAAGHRFAFDRRFGFRHRFAFDHRFGFRHCFAFDHCFGSRQHFIAPFAGFGFGGLFFAPEAPILDFAVPEEFVEANPPQPFAEPEEDEEPTAAHDIRVDSGRRVEPSGGSRSGSGKVVVMRPGYKDEVVAVPRDVGGG